MSDQEFLNALQEITDKPSSQEELYNLYIANLIGAALEFDYPVFEKTFNSCNLKFGFTTTIEKVLYPVLKKIGVLWQREEINPAQEHFVSNIAKQKLFTAIDGIPAPTNISENYLLFLPEFEDHEIGLLYTYFLLSNAGIKTLYLGQRVPFESLKMAAETVNPTHLVFFMTSTLSTRQANNYLMQIAVQFRNKQIYLAGNTAFISSLQIPGEITYLQNPDDLKIIIKK
ncbi:MAG: B12-binding domain-containing protein [Candidatus Dadabacteria bacterium]